MNARELRDPHCSADAKLQFGRRDRPTGPE